MAKLPKDGIVLSTGVLSPPLVTVYGANPNIPEIDGYSIGKINGPESYYVVYKSPNFYSSTTADSTQSVIVDSTNRLGFGFVARSVQGFDKDGITVFENYFYCGKARSFTTSVSDIAAQFPPGTTACTLKVYQYYCEEWFDCFIRVS